MSYIKHRADESLEDYLETILMLQKSRGQVRSIDIANEMNFTKPSVSVAMKNLREKGYITMDSTGYITLTEAGRQRAEDVLERHTLLFPFHLYTVEHSRVLPAARSRRSRMPD